MADNHRSHLLMRAHRLLYAPMGFPFVFGRGAYYHLVDRFGGGLTVAERSRAARYVDRRSSLLIAIYRTLRRAYGPQRWWPVTPPGGLAPEYTGGPRTTGQIFEVAAGAVLTQNTSWKNAACAIFNLNRAGKLDPAAISEIGEGELAALIHPSGYFNQKARRLKILAGYLAGTTHVTREGLLDLPGIGPETADSIMLYAFGKPYFVVDAYTRRIFSRVGVIDGGSSYEEIRGMFEANLQRRVSLYREYHALIVEHGKRSCKRNPLCETCIINGFCEGGGGGQPR
jgi:endonuclease-3 related protein